MRTIRTIFIFCIILIFPFVVIAHEGHDEVRGQWEERAGLLPGELGYVLFDRIPEWFEVNIFTVSTKKKQQKKLLFAQERLFEFAMLTELVPGKKSALQEARDGYEKFLSESRHMAETIIFLDGAEIELAKDFEKRTREHEIFIANLFEDLPDEAQGYTHEMLTTARVHNREIFMFMVEKYQFTDEDIREYGQIARRHIELLRSINGARVQTMADEAIDHIDAGLNKRAYEIIDEAKNILYASRIHEWH